MQVVYDGVKRENKWMGGREWHARRYTDGSRIWRKAEDNLLMLERMIEMAKVRKDRLFVAFIDMEKAYDRVHRN